MFQKSIFNWDQATQGYILGSYYWGYLVTNIPGGILSERYGAKHVVNGGFSVCIISTLITPCLLFYSLGEWKILALLRIICGLGEVITKIKKKIISINFYNLWVKVQLFEYWLYRIPIGKDKWHSWCIFKYERHFLR